MEAVWEPVDWPTYDRYHNAVQTALAFGWVATESTELDGPARVYERGFDRVVIADHGAAIVQV